MKQRFILYRCKVGGMFSVEDTQTKKLESLGTKDRAETKSLLNARNEAARQPQLNLQIAKAPIKSANVLVDPAIDLFALQESVIVSE